MNKFKWVEIGEFQEGAPEGVVEANSIYEAARLLATQSGEPEPVTLPFGWLYNHPKLNNCQVWYMEEPWFSGSRMRQFSIQEAQE